MQQLKTINIEGKLYDDLQHIAEQNKTSLRAYIQHVLLSHKKKVSLQQKLWSDLQIEQVNSEGFLLKDLDERKFFDVQWKPDRTLFCEHDRTKGCKHTSFIWNQIEELDTEDKVSQ